MTQLKDRTFGIEIECFLNNVTRADFTDRFNQLPEIDKGGMKIKDWGPDQWGALASALSPLMEMMQKRRRR